MLALTIEPADPVGDTARELIHALCSEMSERYGAPPSPFSLSEAAMPRTVFLVARLGGQPVGCGALRRFDENTAEIKRMYVAPAGRRRGIARRILVELERRAGEFGYRAIRLETGVRQPEAQRLYESLRYQRIDAFGPYAGNPTSVCYEKILTGNHDEVDDALFTIRPAQLSDRDALFGLAKAFATSFSVERTAFDSSFANLIESPDVFIAVALAKERVIGYLLGFDHYTFFANGRVSWVEEIMVAEEMRRRGVGRRLMASFEQWAKGRASKLVALATRRAGPFYSSLGYDESASYFRKLLRGSVRVEDRINAGAPESERSEERVVY